MNPEQLRTLRADRTQKAMAAFLGVSVLTYLRWENGHTRIPAMVDKVDFRELPEITNSPRHDK